MGQTFVPILVASGTLALTLRNRIFYLFVTGLGLYTLLKCMIDGFDGPAEDAFVFGMALSGLFVKLCNYMYLIGDEKLQRQNTNDDARSSHGRAFDRLGYKSATGFVQVAQQFCLHFWDAFELVLSSRGIGWKFELRGLFRGSEAGMGRVGFIVQQAWGALWRFVIMDITRQMLMRTQLAGPDPLLGPLDYPLWTQMLLGALIWQWVRWKMELPYRVASAAGVLLGWGQPVAWPPIFGSWRNAWTIRRFWSQSWHQNLRLQTEPSVAWLVDDVLKARRGSLLARYGRAFGIFFAACLIHAYGRVLTGGNPMIDVYVFTSQPVLIVAEDVFKTVTSRSESGLLNERSSRYFGYLWVFIVETMVMTYWMDDLVRKGMFREPVFGFTAVGHLIE